jgi:hypothetical protein
MSCGSSLRTPQRSGDRRPPSDANIVKPLLVDRKTAAVMLGNVSVANLRRLEKLGILKAIRLNPKSKTGKVFYSVDNVLAVAKGMIGP